MKLKTVLILIVFVLSGCAPEAEVPVPQPETPVVFPTEAPATQSDFPKISHPSIVGAWLPIEVQRASLQVLGGEGLLTTEIRATRSIEFTEHYMLFEDYGHTYSWIDPQRIHVDGVVIGIGSTTGDLFYVLGVQLDGDILNFSNNSGEVLARFQKAQ